MVLIHPDNQGYLCYPRQTQLWQFTCLPFGLCNLVLKKLFKPIIDLLQVSQGQVHCLSRRPPALSLRQAEWVITWLQGLSRIHSEHPALVPFQTIQFLGFEIDSKSAVLRLPPAKLKYANFYAWINSCCMLWHALWAPSPLPFRLPFQPTLLQSNARSQDISPSLYPGTL